MLTQINETSGIIKSNSKVYVNEDEIDSNSYVSMNMWGLKPSYIKFLEDGFKDFFENEVGKNPLKAEYLLPIHIGKLLQKNEITVKVLETNDKWFGVTYKEDKRVVVKSIQNLIRNGIYQEELFSDLNI